MHDSNALIGASEITRCNQCGGLLMILIYFQIVWGIDTMRVRVDGSMENPMFLGEDANKRMGIKTII